jgi:hypothetical protein
MHLSHLGTSLKIPLWYKSGCCIRNHFHAFITVETATSQVLFRRSEQMEVRRGKVRTTEL